MGLLPPRVVSEPADGRVVVKKGSSVTIKCLASGNPRPQVTWSKVNQADVVGEGESLELREVSRHQEGIYQCSAGNGVGERAVSQILLRLKLLGTEERFSWKVATGCTERWWEVTTA